jgi:NAD(P)-dependent dehydrogenase (short-subunit alcohol dehydrogenase family)
VPTDIDASQILRQGLLEGVSVLIAGAPSEPGPDSLAEAVRSTCLGLGAEVAFWQNDVPPSDVDLLVVDGAGLFARGRESGGGAGEPPGAARAALSWTLDVAWEATHAVVSGALLPAGRGGRIVYLAPPPDAGIHADGARAGLENLSRTLSTEWARHGITVVTIAPGNESSNGEVAALLAYLASPAGAYFSGALFDLRKARR